MGKSRATTRGQAWSYGIVLRRRDFRAGYL